MAPTVTRLVTYVEPDRAATNARQLSVSARMVVGPDEPGPGETHAQVTPTPPTPRRSPAVDRHACR